MVCLCVCLTDGHVREPCKNGRTDRDAVWETDSHGPKESRQMKVEIPTVRGNF